MAKAKAATEDKPAFDVSLTDKRSDKRVISDYVFASRYAPELLDIFNPWIDQITEALEAIEADENSTAVSTPVDTLIASLSEKLEERYNGDYADYSMRGNGASFFLPKSTRTLKTPQEKAEDLVSKASPEQLEALAALLKARGIELG